MSGTHCSTARDVYLSLVEDVSGEKSFPVALGRAVHHAVARTVVSAKKLKFRAKPNRYDDELLDR